MAKRLKHGDTLDVWGLDYELDLRHKSKELDDKFGYEETKGVTVFSPERRIYIAEDQDVEEKRTTLLHEIIEVFKACFRFGQLSEKKVEELGKGLSYTLTNGGVELWDFE